ncbi:YceI family protein [Pseudoduganella sp. SL102]|uniref:YceI family protein n=1 Tax=Pseudoduganella sp. SL102 TaxID=2995154 RepID=UPI00248AA423|nr:YceI family protein [Pseudoduganella sp. SL102]WBS00881.1 YceI family protein [Pseudoduganella sp. SL102]
MPGRPAIAIGTPGARARRRHAGGAAVLAACLLLAACAVPEAPPVPPAPSPSPASSLATPAATQPADPFAALLAGHAAGPVLRIADDALIAVTVRRGGALARLGHDHVVAARRIDGRVAPAAGLAVLRFRLDEMTVDEAALRQEAGLATQPSADAIAGTRVNMLARVLDAERHPYVEVRAQRSGEAAPLQADVTLHGVTRRYPVAASIEATPQGLTARGTLVLRQTDFGITPFSVMGGALAVQDALEIRFVLPARSAAPDAVR